MPKKVVVLDKQAVRELDRLVDGGSYPNRGSALQAAIRLLVKRKTGRCLQHELTKLNRREEQQLAEESFTGVRIPY